MGGKCFTSKNQNSSNCIFCDIKNNNKEKILHNDDEVFAFHDISKGSAVEHVLVCPKQHIRNVNYLTKNDILLIEHMYEVGKKILGDLHQESDTRFDFLIFTITKYKKRFGFHVPPFYSVDHLHLHCFTLPITNKLKNYYKYGKFLRTIDEQKRILNML